MTLSAFLKEIDLFSTLSVEAIDKVTSNLFEEEIPKGFLLTEKDIPITCLYIIKSGHVQAIEVNEEGAERVLADFKTGDYFGEMSLLTGEPCSATTRAVEDTVVLVLYKINFDELLSENPALNRHFIGLLSQRLRMVNVQIGEAKDKELAFNRFLREEKEFQYSQLVGATNKMKPVLRFVEAASGNDDSILIQGEKGTGKELIARTIHYNSPRKGEPFIAVNCDALEREARGAELFGREKGAFGSADARRLGYLELANGGTLLLKDIDRLSGELQTKLWHFLEKKEFECLGGKETLSANVRIMATTRLDLVTAVEKGLFDADLFSLLEVQSIEVPPLRDRRKEIPALVEHLVQKFSQRMQKKVKGVSAEAMNSLMSHNYPGNIEEMENILERAVILADEDTISADQILLGLPSIEGKAKYNLLRIPLVYRFFQSRFYPALFQVFTVATFSIILYFTFFGTEMAKRNIGSILVWSLWWPTLVISTFFFARMWCAVCPIGAVAGLIQKLKTLKLPLPRFLKQTDFWIMGFLFVLIIWVERIAVMRDSPKATGFLLLSIIAGALIISFLYERKVWCRYICPLGGMVGLYSMSSMAELRANPNVCANQCKTHECYKGGGAEGCPMFQHPLFVESNQSCKICSNCIKNCPNRSVQLNLRFPAQELWALQKPMLGGAFFSILLIGLLLAEILPDLPQYRYFQQVFSILGLNEITGFTALLFFLLLIPIVLFWLVSMVSGQRFGLDTARNFSHYGYALVPLALGGHFANQLRYLPQIDSISIQVTRRLAEASAKGGNTIVASLSLLSPLQIFFTCLGILGALFVVYKIYSADSKGERKSTRPFFYYSGLVGFFGIVFLWLFLFLE